MSLETTVSNQTFNGTGTTGPFSFSIPYHVHSDIQVVKTNAGGVKTTLAEGIDYTLVPTMLVTGEITGGNVNTTSALYPGENIKVQRLIPILQETVLPDGGPFFASTHEKALDRVVMMLQQVATVTQDYLDADQSAASAASSALLAQAYAASAGAAAVPWIDDRGYATLALADAAAVSAGKQLVVSKQWDTVPAVLNASLRIVPGGKINNAGSLAINGGFSCDRRVVFIGAGSITFSGTSAVEVYPEWWVGSDWADLTNKALQAANGNHVVWPSGQLNVTKMISIPSGGVLRGQGRNTVIVLPDAGFTGTRMISNSDLVNGNTKIQISDFTIKVTAATPVVSPGDGAPGILRFERVTGLLISRIYTADGTNTQYALMDLSAGNRSVVVTQCIMENQNTVSGAPLWFRGGMAVDPLNNSFDITVSNNIFASASDEAFGLYAWNNNISRVTVTGNVIINRGALAELAVGLTGHDQVGQVGTLNDVAFIGNAVQGRITVVTGCSRITLSGNTVIGPVLSTKDAIFVGKSGSLTNPTDITVSNNVVNGSSRYCIYNSGDRTVISGNRCNSPTSAGIYTDSPATISNNYVYNTAASGITCAALSCMVFGNVVDGFVNGILMFGDTSGSSVTGNHLIGATTGGGQGITVNGSGGTVSNLTVKGNRIAVTSGNMAYGIRFTNGTFSSGVVSDNSAFGAVTQDMALPTMLRKINNVVTTSQTPYPIITGTTAQRPTALLGTNDRGFVYDDITLHANGYLIRWNGTTWVKADGTAA